MQITVNNQSELLDFIKRNDVNSKQATLIVCKALKVISLFDMAKDEVIEATEYHIKKFCQNNNSEHPIFLGQLYFEFSIKDFYKGK